MESHCGVLSRYVCLLFERGPLWSHRLEGEGGGRTPVPRPLLKSSRGDTAKRLCWARERGRVEAAEIKGGANRIFGLTGWGCDRKIRGDPKFLA